MSPDVKPLPLNELSDKLSPVESLNDRVRDTLRAEKARRRLSERDIANLIQWSQSRVAQKLSGRTPITLNELEGLCFALGISATEAVRDRGLEFVAEMTPTELRLLERIRQLTPDQRAAILQILGVIQNDARRALPQKTVKRGRASGT